MFKDYDKYLTASLKVYLFVLIIIFILKLVGLDYFGIDIKNPTVLSIEKILRDLHLIDIYYIFTMYFYAYMITSIVCKDNSKKMKIYLLCMLPIMIGVKYLDGIINNTNLMFVLDFIMLFVLSFFYKIKSIIKRDDKILNLLKDFIKAILLNSLFQLISMFLRTNHFNSIEYGFIINFILDLDYILLFIIYHKLYFEKGGVVCSQTVVGYSLQKKLNFKKLLKRLQKNWHNFKKEDKVNKLTFIIYFILSFIWNTLTIVLVLFVAKLNDTFIECIFILTSFWLSKRSFGKAFHFASMSKCFIVSNLSYYILNRLTTPLGISILVPIFLGVGLSYITSKFVKKTYKPLYRGMPEDLFEETILKVVDKNCTKYKICYDFYIKNKSVISLSMKYNYTESGIRKIKDRVNNQIKRLNH